MFQRSPFAPFIGRRLFATLSVLLAVFGAAETGRAQTAALNVTNFGANGDAVQILASTVSNSTTITFPPANALSSSDVGKLILLFGAGAPTTPTNNQDLVGQIVAVTNGTNVTISRPAGRTANQVPCTYGTQNAQAFQACVNACAGTNTLVLIPPGNYLLIPPTAVDTNFVMKFWSEAYPAVLLQKGGIHFQGTDPASTVLLGNGAWQLKGQFVYRGEMFQCLGPVTNDAPLIFENLTMDGGVQQGNELNNNMVQTNNGVGWDATHDALVDAGTPPLHAFKEFLNCRFVHWRGEMVKSVVSQTDGFVEALGCSFEDGDASGFNFNFTHLINGCTFSNLDMAMEFYEGYMTGASTFENSTITNVRGGIVLVGALANHVIPPYAISGNSFAAGQFGVLVSPVCNLTVSGNQFFGGTIGLGTDGSAYQGTACNSNILVANNSFYNTYEVLNVGGGGSDRIVNLTVSSNTAWGAGYFATGYGWNTNLVFTGNTSLAGTTPGQQGGLNSTALTGQWFLDSPPDYFPPCSDNDTVGQTNVITYAQGRQHKVWTAATNSVFLLDDKNPLQIPPGAQLVITHTGSHPATYYLSDTDPKAAGMILLGGDIIQCQWSNGHWTVAAHFTVLQPPENIHITTTN